MKCLITFIAFISLTAFVSAASLFNLIEDEWELFKIKHGKKYENKIEESYRMKIYLENRHKIATHNKKSHIHGYTLSMNKFGDLLSSEFNQQMNGFKNELRNNTRQNLESVSFITPANIKIPEKIDWREYGAVTPVKDQGQCGSCWAFSTTGSLEGQSFRKTGNLISLSEQNLMDCSWQYGNAGCISGFMDKAFQYIKENNGIDTEYLYPYEAQNDNCRYNVKNKGAYDLGYVDISQGHEQALMEAVATVGPISIAIDASHQSFHLYSSGVYIEDECSSEKLDHGVLAVGYGTENGQDYWLVKNSWGTSWGDKGYIKMARNRNNQCGVASAASYPLV